MSTLKTEHRVIQITKLVGNHAEVAALRAHLEELIHGEVFSGSLRSQQFLRYVIEKSIELDFDSLKERVIGIKMFGRNPSYDTGEDAIVRVTASDVRKRLLQHYGRYGSGSEFRIDIPPGSYIPEILWTPQANILAIASSAPPAQSGSEDTANTKPGPLERSSSSLSPKVIFFSAPLALLILAFSFWLGYRAHKPKQQKPNLTVLPWSAILNSGQTLQIVTGDADLASVQDILGYPISLADYADRKYFPDHTTLSPEYQSFVLKYLNGTRAADVDLPIIGSILTLVSPKPEEIHVRTARHISLDEFHTDDDFILLGSPMSNPWDELYSPQLDFRFTFTYKPLLEVIENVKPRGKELKVYTPTSNGFEIQPRVRTSYAIIAFLQNPHQSGHVMILAGTDSSSTAGAAQLITNVADLPGVLRNCDGPPKEPLRNFELLLKFNVVDGSEVNTDVIACHRLYP